MIPAVQGGSDPPPGCHAGSVAEDQVSGTAARPSAAAGAAPTVVGAWGASAGMPARRISHRGPEQAVHSSTPRTATEPVSVTPPRVCLGSAR